MERILEADNEDASKRVFPPAGFWSKKKGGGGGGGIAGGGLEHEATQRSMGIEYQGDLKAGGGLRNGIPTWQLCQAEENLDLV